MGLGGGDVGEHGSQNDAGGGRGGSPGGGGGSGAGAAERSSRGGAAGDYAGIGGAVGMGGTDNYGPGIGYNDGGFFSGGIFQSLMETLFGKKNDPNKQRSGPAKQDPKEAYSGLRSQYRDERGIVGAMEYDDKSVAGKVEKGISAAMSSPLGGVVGGMVGQAINAIEQDKQDSRRAAAEMADRGFTDDEINAAEKGWRDSEMSDLSGKTSQTGDGSDAPASNNSFYDAMYAGQQTFFNPPASKKPATASAPESTTPESETAKKRKRNPIGYLDMRHTDPLLASGDILSPILISGEF